MLMETIKATRKAVGNDFPIGVKLNSADFQKGGFTHEDSIQVAQWLNDAGLDLLEVSGGSYEQPRLLGYTGKEKDATEIPKAESTVKREAYFLEYAAAMRKVATRMPLLVTGGFRTKQGMETALAGGDCDVIGLGRPLCGEPDLPKRLLSGAVSELPRYEKRMSLGPGILAPTTKVFLFKIINVFGQQGWYYLQLMRLADGKLPDFKLGVFGAFWRYLLDEYKAAWRLHRARRKAA
jgi:2,4-dienoyl-CoA reductase-like NADH-dependent reductase (Old Yellow Enzyme family)